MEYIDLLVTLRNSLSKAVKLIHNTIWHKQRVRTVTASPSPASFPTRSFTLTIIKEARKAFNLSMQRKSEIAVLG